MIVREEVIGKCRLILGDAKEILPTLSPVHLIFTDPPYGHNNNNNNDLIHRREFALGQATKPPAVARPIQSDDPASSADLINTLFSLSPQLLHPGCCCCCLCGGGGPDPAFARWALEMGKHLDFKQMIIWDKGPIGMGWHYRRSYETILVGQRRGARCAWFDTTHKIENIIRHGQFGIRKIIPRANDHPTPKPPELAEHFIRLHTAEEHTVLDPFMGGGSTAVACVRTNRAFIGIELEEKWFDMACERVSGEVR